MDRSLFLSEDGGCLFSQKGVIPCLLLPLVLISQRQSFKLTASMLPAKLFFAVALDAANCWRFLLSCRLVRSRWKHAQALITGLGSWSFWDTTFGSFRRNMSNPTLNGIRPTRQTQRRYVRRRVGQACALFQSRPEISRQSSFCIGLVHCWFGSEQHRSTLCGDWLVSLGLSQQKAATACRSCGSA
jgi:hypothetical protein